MKKRLILAIALTLFVTGCQSGGTSSGQPAELPESGVQTETPLQGESVPQPEAEAADPLAGLIRDEYEGIEMTAAVLERKAILRGFAVPVTVTIRNTGDKTIFYTRGSGVYETPEAVFLRADGLQPVIPKDHLGPIMTMDLVTEELKPGESLEYKLYVMAIQPNANFDRYTFDLFENEGTYIAELEWPALREKHPDLVGAAPGSYVVNAYFLYFIADENGQGDPLGAPTGYARAECVIGVS